MFVRGRLPEVQPRAITVLADTATRTKDLDEKAALKTAEAMASKTSKEEIAPARPRS